MCCLRPVLVRSHLMARSCPGSGPLCPVELSDPSANVRFMGDEQQLRELSAQAAALRRAGKSRREIKEITGIANNEFLTDALRGIPPPEWTRRPNAKDDLRAKARILRGQGHTYVEIAADLGVSKGSVSLWVRDMPRVGRLSEEESRGRNRSATSAYWQGEQFRRVGARQGM